MTDPNPNKLVTQEHWSFWLGDMPMPEGATREMMWAARDALDEIERRDEAIEGIANFTKSLEHYEKRLAEETDPEKRKTLESILKSTNEILDTYRSWLE